MNIICKHSNLNFTQIKSLHHNSHQRKTIYDKSIFLAKLIRQYNQEGRTKFEID